MQAFDLAVRAQADAIIGVADFQMATYRKKREWFDLGAAALALQSPGMYDPSTYCCPICINPFTMEAIAEKRLSAEHVPPESVGGRELLLTCTACNNSAGTKLDAHAKTKEDVRIAKSGAVGRPHRIKAFIGDLRVNGELHTSGGKYSLKIPPNINKPGTNEALRNLARAGTQLTVQHEPFSELGARISWLRSGYLTLFAEFGYKVALDPAMQIVRQQILESDERKMISFISDAQQDFPFTVRRIMRVLDPQWHKGWVVQFGRYLVQLPSVGDMTFYERIAEYGVECGVQNTTYEYWGWPTKPTFGVAQVIKSV
jgi:hypothetical protein